MPIEKEPPQLNSKLDNRTSRKREPPTPPPVEPRRDQDQFSASTAVVIQSDENKRTAQTSAEQPQNRLINCLWSALDGEQRLKLLEELLSGEEILLLDSLLPPHRPHHEVEAAKLKVITRVQEEIRGKT